jgi:hypothetical protein
MDHNLTEAMMRDVTETGAVIVFAPHRLVVTTPVFSWRERIGPLKSETAQFVLGDEVSQRAARLYWEAAAALSPAPRKARRSTSRGAPPPR